MQQVHLRINDAATGQPTPVRLRVTDADGNYYAPHGRLTDFATGVNQDIGGNVLIGGRKWCYIDGACEILLPPGQLRFEISKGFEYKPIDENITLHAGKMALRLTIERWRDMRSEGWFAGDTRAHFLSLDAALLEGQAEDLAVVNLLAQQTTVTDTFGKLQPALPNILSFSGQAFARQTTSCGVAVNTHNIHRDLGSLGLLHCHRVVYPLSADATDWTLDDWCGQCHRKKGLVVWTNPQHQTAEFLFGEPLADLILGNIDAFELTFFEDSPFDALADYYRLQDAGLHVPLVGASGKECNADVLGSMRTYVHLPVGQEFTYAGWIEAIRAGRTFVTNGPLLVMTIDGGVSGSRFEKGGGVVRVEAHSATVFDRVDLLLNGEVIASAAPGTQLPFTAVLEHAVPADSTGWLAARCTGQGLVPSRPAPQRVFAHTSPVVLGADRPSAKREEALEALAVELDHLLQWAQRKQFIRLMPIVEQARKTLDRRSRPGVREASSER